MTRRSKGGALADLTPHASGPEVGSDRAFGFVFAFALIAIGAWPLLGDREVRWWALAIAAAFAVLAIARPATLRPLNRGWMQFGLLLGRIVSPVVLFVVYCFAVVPTGLLMRLASKDPLRRRLDARAGSYWIHRVPPGRPDGTMTRQF